MADSSRELVRKTLEFKKPERVPRHMWELPWAKLNYPEEYHKIKKDFPDDIIMLKGYTTRELVISGDRYEPGIYIDEWGCKFINYQRGIVGESKEPLIKDEDWADTENLRVPEELLTVDKDKVNKFCKNTDKFIIGDTCPRPFERMQFIRGTEQLYIDLILQPKGMFKVLSKVHDFYCNHLSAWADTDVDGLWFMDDWGSQKDLLIGPELWKNIFKPLYKDYIDIAHQKGKKIFMHSDGHIIKIIPHLIELGLDAINSQIFCMGVENLRQFKGQITFWGEIDRQYILAHGTADEVVKAVNLVKENLWDNGGCIAQCEFGPGAKPENVYKVFETWNRFSFL